MRRSTNRSVYGKMRNDFLERIIRPRLGSRKRMEDLLVGPGVGLDNAVIRLEEGIHNRAIELPS